MTHFPDRLAKSLQDTYVRTGYVYEIYDGDTVYYHTSLGYGVMAMFQIGRLLRVQAPEVWPLVTREAGEASKAFLWDLIQQYALNRHHVIRPFGYKFKVKSLPARNKHFDGELLETKGKYGRWLVELLGADEMGNPVNLNEMMLASEHAREYD